MQRNRPFKGSNWTYTQCIQTCTPQIVSIPFIQYRELRPIILIHENVVVADIFLGPSPSSSWVTLTSLTLRIALSKTQSAVEQVVKIMNGLGRPAKLREVTVDLIFPTITLLDIVALSPRKYLELKALLQHFSQANIRLSPHHPINFRTRNFWREHVERCLPSETPGAVPVTLRYTYCEYFCVSNKVRVEC